MPITSPKCDDPIIKPKNFPIRFQKTGGFSGFDQLPLKPASGGSDTVRIELTDTMNDLKVQLHHTMSRVQEQEKRAKTLMAGMIVAAILVVMLILV